jgi:uncharacterized protein YggL (DUF469 family)
MGLNVREGEIMAKNRSRRLRKKMHIEEFQEVGFSVAWRFPEGTSCRPLSISDVDAFIDEVIEPNTSWRLTAAVTWRGKV